MAENTTLAPERVHPLREIDSKVPGYLLTLNWPVDVIGGVNEAMVELARELRTSDYQPTIAITTWSRQPQPAQFRGIEVIGVQLREPVSVKAGFRLLPGFLRTLISDLKALLAVLRSRNIQVVNAYFPTLDVVNFLILKRLGLYRGKLILTFQGGDIVEIGRSTGLIRKIWQRVLLSADGLVACSNALRMQVLEVAPNATVTAIHNGANLALFSERKPVPRPSIRRILHIGRFEHKKSQDIILPAFKKLLDSYPDCSLTLIGGSGPLLDQTRELISRLELNKQVEMHVDVPHDSLPEFMSNADLFILPSRIEPFGIVLLEAGAAGLPVIAAKVGGIPELIENEVTGLLISPDSVDELETAMRRLVENPKLTEDLGRKWNAHVLSNFGWNVTCQKYLKLIGELKATTDHA